MDPLWHGRVNSLNLAGVAARLCTDGGHYPRVIDEFPGDFDIILIDGAERNQSAQKAASRLAAGGVIILDNTEWYAETARMLRTLGYTQLDLCGFPPLNAFTSVTSLFFQQGIRFSYLSKPTGWRPIGGRSIPGGALDDRAATIEPMKRVEGSASLPVRTA